MISGETMRLTHPERSNGSRLSVAVPFALVAVIGVAAAVLPLDGVPGRWLAAVGVCVGLTIGLFAASALRPDSEALRLLAPISFLLLVAVARDLGDGGAGGVAMVLLPSLWLALTGTFRELAIVGVLTVLTLILPIVVIGPPDYPVEEWRRVIAIAAMVALLTPLIQQVVRRLDNERARAQIGAAHLDGLMRGTAGTTMVSFDRDGTVRSFNVGAEQLFGIAAREVVGRVSVADLHDPDELADLAREFQVPSGFAGLVALADSEGADRIFSYRRADGEEAAVRLVLTKLKDEQGATAGYLAVGHDTTEMVEAQRALESVNTQFRRLFTDAPHGVAVLDSSGEILMVNRSLRGIVGLTTDRLVGEQFSDLGPPGDDTVLTYLREVVAAGGRSVSTDCSLLTGRGGEAHVALSSRLIRDGGDLHDIIFVNVVDVSERRRYQEQLSHLVDHDVLTGLANRRRFDTELNRRLAGFRLHGTPGALLLLDLDHFKQVNDTMGHNAGDQLLVDVAAILVRAVRTGDIVARLGGDEFAVVLADTDQSTAEQVAAEIVEQVAAYAGTQTGAARRLTCSVGVVTFRSAQDQPGDVLALADMTMYDAKEAGRNRYAVLPEGGEHQPQMGVRLAWQRRIEDALEQDRFEIWLQPVMNLRESRVVSAEVLLRMRDEHGELHTPARFLETAERVGLMGRVDVWVVEHAIELLARLRTYVPNFALEVNLSGQSIGDPDIEEAIVSSLERHRVDPAALILEVTETVAIGDVQAAREFAERITAIGAQFALDDFGAGFGSFYYLKHLIFDYVKIDGEFVATLAGSAIDRSIVRSIVQIAHDLGKRTVAEFVVDQEVLDIVREEGVDFGQGYFIGAPMPYGEFVDRFLRVGSVAGPAAAPDLPGATPPTPEVPQQ